MDKPLTRRRTTTPVRFALSIVGTGVLIAILLFVVDMSSVARMIAGLSNEALLIGAGTTGLAFVATGVRWWVFLRHVRFPQGLFQTVGIRQIGQALNMSIPGGVAGDFLQILLVSRRPKVSGAPAASSILIDRLVGLVGIFLVVAVTSGYVGTRWTAALWVAPVGAGVMIGVVAALFMAPKYQGFVAERRIGQPIRKFLSFASRVAELAKSQIRNPRVLFVTIVLAVGGQVLVSIAPWLILRDIAPVPFVFVLPVISLVSLVSLVPITVSGLGLREWVFFAAFQSFGIGLEEAIGLSLAWLAVTLVTSWFLAGVSLLLTPAAIHRRIGAALRRGRGSIVSQQDPEEQADEQS